MEITERQREIQKAIAQALHKGSENSDFRARLMKSPVEVIESLVDYKLSESEILEIINEDFTDDLELNEAQLELVAGGGYFEKKWNDLVTWLDAHS